MPTSPKTTALCRYGYDPLDRSTEWQADKQSRIQRFYCEGRLASEINSAVKHSLMQHALATLAQQQQQDAAIVTTLFATNQQRSVLSTIPRDQLAYTPYGYHSRDTGLVSLLGFNGERPDPVTGHHHLGNGYRQFNPVLMRFNSPDSWSPFGEGGVNAYGYCGGDPINRVDPTGHSWRGWIARQWRRALNMPPKQSKTLKISNNATAHQRLRTQTLSKHPPQPTGREPTPAPPKGRNLTPSKGADATSTAVSAMTQQPQIPAHEQTTSKLIHRRIQSFDSYFQKPISTEDVLVLKRTDTKNPITNWLLEIYASSNPEEQYRARLLIAMRRAQAGKATPADMRTIRTGGWK